jgi:Rrf2 family protein
MISLTAEYALRAVVALGSNPGAPRTTHQLADQTLVPTDYLAKVLRLLSRAGLVTAQRGLKGGFLLFRALNELTILDVINAVDPLRRIDSCPLGLAGHADSLCPLHRRLDQGIAQLEELFGSITIGQLIAEKTPRQDVCLGVAFQKAPGLSRGRNQTLASSSHALASHRPEQKAAARRPQAVASDGAKGSAGGHQQSQAIGDRHEDHAAVEGRLDRGRASRPRKRFRAPGN